MKFTCLVIVAAVMASLVTAVPLDTNEHENKPKGHARNVAAHHRRLIANMEVANTIPNEQSHVIRRKAVVVGDKAHSMSAFKFSEQPPTETLTDSYLGEKSNPNPALTVTNQVSFGTAASYGMACGGAILLYTHAIVQGSIITTGALTTGDGAMVFGDIDCVDVSLGANTNFHGNIVSQGAVNIGANTIFGSGSFAGDIYSTGVITVGANVEVKGNVKACAALTQGAAASITGQVLMGASSLAVPSSKVSKVLDDITAALNYLWSQQPVAIDLAGSIYNAELVPGIYKQVGQWGVASGETLTFNGSSSDTWIIQVDGAISVAGEILLIGGALPSNIFWVTVGSISVGTNTMFYGNIVSLGTVIVAAGASLHGAAYSAAGACSIGAGATLAGF